MQKLALPVTAATLVAGIFGAFLRWLQCRSIFDAETGLARPGAVVSIIFAAYLLAAAAAFFWIARFRVKDLERPLDARAALRAATGVPGALIWLCCALFAAGGILLMFTAGDARYTLLQRLFGAVCIVAGVCLTALPQRSDAEGTEGAGENASGARACTVIATLCFCFWLVQCYWVNAEDPVLWNYLPEILAVAASTTAVYYVTAYFYGRARPRAALFFLQLGAFLDLCTLFDGMAFAMKLPFAAAAFSLLLLEYLAVENMREPDAPEIAPVA